MPKHYGQHVVIFVVICEVFFVQVFLSFAFDLCMKVSSSVTLQFFYCVALLLKFGLLFLEFVYGCRT